MHKQTNKQTRYLTVNWRGSGSLNHMNLLLTWNKKQNGTNQHHAANSTL